MKSGQRVEADDKYVKRIETIAAVDAKFHWVSTLSHKRSFSSSIAFMFVLPLQSRISQLSGRFDRFLY